MEDEQITNWLKDNDIQNIGLRTDKYNLYLSDVLYYYSKATFQQLQTRIKELEDNQTTELIHRTGDLTHDFWYFCAECLENFEMDHGFNYCPNCGRKIIRK